MKFQPDFGGSTETHVSYEEISASPSVIKILSGALDAIGERGVRRLSMSDIIEASGVSRGTLYKYFSNKDDVLAAVAEFVCTGFENGIADAARGIDDPVERFRAVMLFYSRYTNENSPDRVFEVEPQFHLSFFRTRFSRYKAAVANALADEHVAGTRNAIVDRSLEQQRGRSGNMGSGPSPRGGLNIRDQ